MLRPVKQENPLAYLDRLKGRGNGGVRSDISGVGYEVTIPSRTRRRLATIAGLTASADRHLSRSTLSQLREICRAHDRQSGIFSGMLDRAGDNVYGSDFNFIPNTGDNETNKIYSEYILWRMEAPQCDAVGVMDFSEIGKASLRAIWNDGDNLLAKRKDGTLGAFEADQIVTPNEKGDRRIIMGVELNDNNRPLAYHISQRHTSSDSGSARVNNRTQRLAASDAIVPSYRKRFNQTRGIPYVAAALSRYTRFSNYTDNESLAAEVNSMQGIKITKLPADEDMGGTKDNDDPKTNDTFEKLQKFEPFSVYELAEGEDVEMFGSTRPGDTFEPYITTMCRLVGVAVGYPLELLMLDFSKTNYSSARASLGEARKMFRAWQKFCLIHLCRPWYRWQITRGIASGKLPPVKDAYKFQAQWPAWPYIDPVKEAKGNEIFIKIRTKSVSQCIREMGNDPDEVFAEMAAEQEKMTKLGLVDLDAAAEPDVDTEETDEDADIEAKETDDDSPDGRKNDP